MIYLTLDYVGWDYECQRCVYMALAHIRVSASGLPKVTSVSKRKQHLAASTILRRFFTLGHRPWTCTITMRNFWALPAVLRIAIASQHAFSVFDDILAFPQVRTTIQSSRPHISKANTTNQYEVVFPNTYITEHDATSLLSHSASHSASSATTKSQETQELSKPNKPSTGTSSSDATLEETYEAVVLGGQRYLCSIPVIPDEVPQNSTATAEQVKAEEEKELMRAADRGWELLDGMQGECIYFLSGWWSYSFCYKDEVKQFHQLPPSRGVPIYPPVEDTSEKSYVLGRFKGDKKTGKGARKTLGKEEGTKQEVDDEGVKDKGKGLELSKLETKGSTRYMVQRLSGGTECDLTGRERKIEVQVRSPLSHMSLSHTY
jgi:protein OS-9